MVKHIVLVLIGGIAVLFFLVPLAPDFNVQNQKMATTNVEVVSAIKLYDYSPRLDVPVKEILADMKRDGYEPAREETVIESLKTSISVGFNKLIIVCALDRPYQRSLPTGEWYVAGLTWSLKADQKTWRRDKLDISVPSSDDLYRKGLPGLNYVYAAVPILPSHVPVK